MSVNKVQPGFSKEDFIGKSNFEITPPPGLDQLKAAFSEVIEKAIPVEYEAPDYGPHKTPAWYQHCLVPEIENDEISSLLMIVTDITERKHKETQQLALQHVREVLWGMKQPNDIDKLMDAIGKSLEIQNIDFFDYGINKIDTSIHSLEEILHPKDRTITWRSWRKKRNRGIQWRTWEEVKPVLSSIWRSGKVSYRRDLENEDFFDELEGLGIGLDGRVHSVIDIPFSHGTLAVNSSEPNAFSEENIRELQALAEVLSEGFQRLEDLQKLEERNQDLEAEIAERKQTEEEIRKFKTIADRAGYGSAISDLEGYLIYVNESFAKMHGYAADELMGKNLSIFHNEEQIENVNRLKERLRQEGSYVAEEVWHNRKDNSVFPTADSTRKCNFLV